MASQFLWIRNLGPLAQGSSQGCNQGANQGCCVTELNGLGFTSKLRHVGEGPKLTVDPGHQFRGAWASL